MAFYLDYVGGLRLDGCLRVKVMAGGTLKQRQWKIHGKCVPWLRCVQR